jgi:hypothetical protein
MRRRSSFIDACSWLAAGEAKRQNDGDQRLATVDKPHRRILSRVRCIALFGETIRVSVLGFKLEMKSRLFPKTCFDEPLPD